MRGRPPEAGSERSTERYNRPPKTGVENAITEPPRPLSARAQELWDDIVPDLIARGVYVQSDKHLLYMSIVTWAIALENLEAYAEMSLEDRGSPEGKRLFVSYKDSSAIVERFGTQLALTPGARVRLGLSVAKAATLLSQFEDM